MGGAMTCAHRKKFKSMLEHSTHIINHLDKQQSLVKYVRSLSLYRAWMQ